MKQFVTAIKEEPGYSALILGLLLIGTAIRCYIPFVEAPYFVNDGGLHYVMAKELIANQFVPPATTNYNYMNIPFVYPPLTVYLLAGVNALFGIPVEVTLRYLPAILSSAALVATLSFLQAVCRSRAEVATALMIVATIPNAFVQQIKGGGLPRSLGALFAILAMREVWLLLKSTSIPAQNLASSRRYHVKALGVFAGLTVLSHPEWSFVLFIFALSALLARRTKVLVADFSIAGVLAITLALPWAIHVYSNHGMAPVLALVEQVHNDGVLYRILSLDIFFELGDVPIRTLAYVGLAVCIAERNYVIPLFACLSVVLISRGLGFVLYLPCAMLAAVGLSTLAAYWGRAFSNGEEPDGKDRAGRVSRIAFSLLLGLGLVTAVKVLKSHSVFTASLDRASLEALAWVKENTPGSSRFLLLTGVPWWNDHVSEIFPALAERQSILTCQGREWLPHKSLRHCVETANVMLEPNVLGAKRSLVEIFKEPSPDYLWVSTTRKLGELNVGAQIEDRVGEVVFRNGAVTIYEIPLGAKGT